METLLLPIRSFVALVVLGFVDHPVATSSQRDRPIARYVAEDSHPDAYMQVPCGGEPCEPERPALHPDRERIARVLDHRAACLTLPTKRPVSAKRYGIQLCPDGFDRGPDPPKPHIAWRTKPVNWDSLEMVLRAQHLRELAHLVDSLIRATCKDSTLAMP